MFTEIKIDHISRLNILTYPSTPVLIALCASLPSTAQKLADSHLVVSEPGNMLISGDFTFHVDDESNQEAMIFCDLIDSFNLKQHVTCPTHSYMYMVTH